MKPRAVDLFCGLGGWTEGLLAAGYHARGYDIEAHEYGDEKYPSELILADVLTLDGAQFKDAALIVASPPCQEFSYMAMPWRRAKQIARALRGQDEFPEGYRGSRTIAELTALFDACFRIQREAIEAAGRYIPMVVENVRGAEPWVGRARWSFGSYYLWGDVPALMPSTLKARKNPGFRFDGSGRSFQSESVNRHVGEGRKSRGMDWNGHPKGSKPVKHNYKAEAFNDARRIAAQVEAGKGGSWFEDNDGPMRKGNSKSPARKAASARIAKIPFALSSWIARTYYPHEARRIQA